ncbi:MAG: ABC transporter permease subunit, partial [Cyanobacteria bacterium P01_H01_bin.58]
MRDFSHLGIVFALLWATRWTILLSVIAFVCGGMAGLLLMLMRISPFRPLKYISWAYIEVVQGTPLLIQFL